MSVIYNDSFSGYSTPQINVKLTGGVTGGGGNNTIVPGAGRNGNGALSMFDSGSVDFILPTPTLGLVAAFAMKTTAPPATGAGNVLRIFSNPPGEAPAGLTLNNLGGFTISAGNALASSDNGLWFQNSYFHLQLKVIVNSYAAGVMNVTTTLKFNNVQVATVTGSFNTSVGTLTDVELRFQTGGQTILFSDFYLIDTTDGVAPTDFAGDLFTIAIFPNGVGSSTQMTPVGAAANWQCVDENPPDADATYVKTNTAGQEDTYQFPAFPIPNVTIIAVQENIFVRKDDAGTRVVSTLVNSGGSDFVNAAQFSIGDTYDYYFQCLSLDPKTAAAWLVANACGPAGAKWGQKLIS